MKQPEQQRVVELSKTRGIQLYQQQHINNNNDVTTTTSQHVDEAEEVQPASYDRSALDRSYPNHHD